MDRSLTPLDKVYAAPDPVAHGAPPRPLEEDPAEVARQEKLREVVQMRARGAKLLGLSFAGFGLAIVVGALGGGGLATFVVIAASFLAAGGTIQALVALTKGASVSAGAGAAAWSISLAAANLFMTLMGLFAAWLSTMTFTRGRQIRSFGKILLPPVEARAEAWTVLGRDAEGTSSELALTATTRALDAPTRSALAAQWRENGRTEHASVAAFARLTLDLMALGAPPELVAGANRDALDEIRHAELCFGLARALDGRADGPGAFPIAAKARSLAVTRTMALAELAVDSLIDGALHEGVSARIVAKLARRCEDPAIGAMMKEIAADEGRHARHGWDVVKWCVAEGGEPVVKALAGAVRMLPPTMSSPMPAEARDGRWERFGLMGEAMEAEEHRAARADVVRRVADVVANLAPGASAAA